MYCKSLLIYLFIPTKICCRNINQTLWHLYVLFEKMLLLLFFLLLFQFLLFKNVQIVPIFTYAFELPNVKLSALNFMTRLDCRLSTCAIPPGIAGDLGLFSPSHCGIAAWQASSSGQLQWKGPLTGYRACSDRLIRATEKSDTSGFAGIHHWIKTPRGPGRTFHSRATKMARRALIRSDISLPSLVSGLKGPVQL